VIGMVHGTTYLLVHYDNDPKYSGFKPGDILYADKEVHGFTKARVVMVDSEYTYFVPECD
jgi:hypothetical protein